MDSHLFAQKIDLAMRKIPVGSVWRHKKGGTYVVTGHAIDSETTDVRITYRRLDGPSFDSKIEAMIAWSRPLAEWVEPDRFIRTR